jgi:predicted acyltransferase
VKAVRHHIASLDVFRGMAIAAMMLVNNPGNWGAVYPPLLHTNWNGWTLADAVFPCFIFIVGVTLPFAFGRNGDERAGKKLERILFRSVMLFALGLLLNLIKVSPDVSALRVPGVLQRIGLTYAIVAPLVAFTGIRAWVAATAALLAIHTGLLVLVPFGGQIAGTMTAGHNLPGFVDARLFGAHMLTPTDPEGIVGTLSAAATMLCGAIAGGWLRAVDDSRRRMTGLVVGGFAALVLALLWSRWLPLNKPIWTGSYALASAGGAAVIFACCYYIVDVRSWKWWTGPFKWLGVNPLAIYFLSELTGALLEKRWLEAGAQRVGLKDALFWRYLARPIGDLGGVRSSLTFAVAFALVWIVVAGVLYRRGIRVRV